MSLLAQALGFEPIAPGATEYAELTTVTNQALLYPGAPLGTLQVRILFKAFSMHCVMAVCEAPSFLSALLEVRCVHI